VGKQRRIQEVKKKREKERRKSGADWFEGKGFLLLTKRRYTWRKNETGKRKDTAKKKETDRQAARNRAQKTVKDSRGVSTGERERRKHGEQAIL